MRVRGCGMAVFLAAALALTAGCARSPEAKKARYLDRGDRYFKQEQYRDAIIEYRNALRIDAKNTQALRQLGLSYYQLGQLGQSFPFLLKAQELEPDNVEINLKLAGLYLRGGRPDEGRGQIQRVLERDPKNLDALVLLAGAAVSPPEIDAALRRLEASRPEFESKAKLHLALGNLMMRKGDQAGGERSYLEAVAREPKSVEAHVTLGNFYVLKRAMPDAEREFKTAAALAPSGSPAQVKLADFYLLLGNPDEARRVLTEVTTKAPDYLPAWRLLAEIAFAQGRIDDTSKALDVILKKNASDLDGRMLRGRVHLARRETDAAIQEFQAVLKAEPRAALARYQMGLAQLQAGNIQQAKAELKEAINIAPNFLDAILLLAQVNIQTGAVQPAVEDLERLLAKSPEVIPAYVLLSGAYLSQQKFASASEIGRRLKVAAPQDARGPYVLGLGQRAQGQKQESRREFERALTLAPTYIDPLSQLASLAVADKQIDAAIERVRAQIALAPKSGPHQALLGDLYLMKGEPKPAEEVFLKAIELEPRMLGPYIRLGAIYAAAGQFDQAIAKVNQAVKASPGNASPLMVAAVLYEGKGDVAKARELYEQVLAINPRFAPAANNLAWIYSEHGGDKDKALQLAQTAKEMAPDDPRISDTLGWILYKRGVYQRALALLRESVDKLPTNPQVQYHVGMAYSQVGDKDSARKALTAAISAPADFSGKDDARKALAALK